MSEAGRSRPHVRNPASGAGLVQPRTTGTQERLSGRGTSSEAVGFPGADFELRARSRTATVADTDAHKASTDTGQSRLQNQLEALLEEAHIKLSSLVSDLLGASARRMLHALAEGETDPAALATLADQRLRATPAELRDALCACTELNPVYRRLVRLALNDLQLIEQQIGQLDQEIASLLRQHQNAVERLAEVPGLGVDSAQQIIAEVGAKAATFASAKNLVSWVGACPGDEESAGVNRSKRSPKGNRQMRRILYQAANAAVKHKGSIFEIVYRRFVLRLGHNKTIGAIAHRLCQLIWIILHKGVRYEERGPAVCERSKRLRTSRMIRTLRNLGYRVEPLANST
jgi:transposase